MTGEAPKRNGRDGMSSDSNERMPAIFAAHGAPAPLLVAAGAAADATPAVSFPITGWWMDGAFTKRSVRLD